jgi:hypothetical protein
MGNPMSRRDETDEIRVNHRLSEIFFPKTD